MGDDFWRTYLLGDRCKGKNLKLYKEFKMSIRIYAVGGQIRDELLGLPFKDRDFCVLAPSYEDMKNYLLNKGVHIHVEKPEFFTIRGRDKILGDVDFVLGR